MKSPNSCDIEIINICKRFDGVGIVFEKDNYKIKIYNHDNVKLKGYYVKGSLDACILAFAGLGGTFDKMFCAIAEFAQSCNISFVFGYTQASYIQHEFTQRLSDGGERQILKGGAYEDYFTTLDDMRVWINYVLKQGYKKIFLMGASLACNRLISLLNTTNIPEVAKLVLICPQDIQKQVDLEMLSEAEENIKNGKGEILLSKKVFDFCEICGRTYKEIFTAKYVNNLPYLSTDADFSMFKKISVPILAVIGERDQGLQNTELTPTQAMEVLQKNNDNLEFKIVDGARHSFKNYEDQLAKLVVEFLRK